MARITAYFVAGSGLWRTRTVRGVVSNPARSFGRLVQPRTTTELERCGPDADQLLKDLHTVIEVRVKPIPAMCGSGLDSCFLVVLRLPRFSGPRCQLSYLLCVTVKFIVFPQRTQRPPLFSSPAAKMVQCGIQETIGVGRKCFAPSSSLSLSLCHFPFYQAAKLELLGLKAYPESMEICLIWSIDWLIDWKDNVSNGYRFCSIDGLIWFS